MSPATNELFKAAQALPESERIELASALWETLDEEADDPQIELSPEWQAEIRRRIEESDRGEGISLTEEEVEQRLRDRYGPLPD